MHELDDEGRLLRTVVTRESEWDDQERAKMLALAEHEASMCACGFPARYADTDPDLAWVERTCPVCAAVARNHRIVAAADEDATEKLGKKPDPEVRRPADGRHTSLATKPQSSQ